MKKKSCFHGALKSKDPIMDYYCILIDAIEKHELGEAEILRLLYQEYNGIKKELKKHEGHFYCSYIEFYSEHAKVIRGIINAISEGNYRALK